MSDYPNRPGFVRDCDTSENAADSLNDQDLSRMRAAVFNFTKKHGYRGSTCDEVEVALLLKHQTASARIRELVLGGYLEDSSRRRPTRSNRPARVYVCRENSSHDHHRAEPDDNQLSFL
jgi:hypothetical protein